MFTVSFRQIVTFRSLNQLTRDSSVGRAEDCSCYLAILRSPVQIRLAGSFYKMIFLKLDFDILTKKYSEFLKTVRPILEMH